MHDSPHVITVLDMLAYLLPSCPMLPCRTASSPSAAATCEEAAAARLDSGAPSGAHPLQLANNSNPTRHDPYLPRRTHQTLRALHSGSG